MGFINLADKTINAKLVYYGAGLGGKTTSLQYIHEVLCPRNEVKLVSINTDEDATLLFDFLPINLGQVEGFKIRIQGYTVPGQLKYRAMRKYVLSGADAVVMVIDSQACRLEDNLQALEDLKGNLQSNGLDPGTIPLVLQYNKQDLPDLTPVEELDRQFKFRDLPSFTSIATRGEGVFETFCEASRSLVAAKISQYGLGDEGRVEPLEVAAGAVAKLIEAKEKQEARRREGPRTLDVVTLSADGSVEDPKDPAARSVAAMADLAPDEPGVAGEGIFELPAEWEIDPGEEEAREKDREPDEELLGQVVKSNVELANLYAELEEYKNLLEKKNNELVEISQIISHDLKKPLTALKTVISLLRGGYLGKLNERQADAVQNAFEAGNYMEELIQDILDSSRIEHDGMELELEKIDLGLLVGEILSRFKYHLNESGVHVQVEDLPEVTCDHSAITKVFTNLVGNAINYRDEEREALVRISCREEEEFFRFQVEDNGIGIPEGDREKIFSKFKRGSNTGGVNGTGLGLYIVRSLVRRHGGDVTFESRRGEGTTFTISLPREPVEARCEVGG